MTQRSQRFENSRLLSPA